MEHEPPTPKRRRLVKGRVRVTRACDICKSKKLRCSGTQPCSVCIKAGRICQYDADYKRGRLPVIPASAGDRAGSHLAGHHPNEFTHHNCISRSTRRMSSDLGQSVRQTRRSPVFVSNQSNTTAAESEAQYVGPSSGISFLRRAQQRLQSTFDFTDAPLPRFDPHFLILPSRHDARLLVSHYFDFGFPTHRFLHRPTVEVWLEEFYETISTSTEPQIGERERRALLLVMMGHAKKYDPKGESGFGNNVNSPAYFGASDHQLSLEQDSTRLVGIQARVAQCFYLLSESRTNHASNLLGTTIRLALAIGLHRQRKLPPGPASSTIDHECRKRVFWCLYNLDTYLSAMLGRPRTLHDDDIDQELPACLDDLDLVRNPSHVSRNTSQSLMLAPLYHARMSKIACGILRDFYGLSRPPLSERARMVPEYEGQLERWRKGIADFLDADNSSLSSITYQRQQIVLWFALAHTQILLYRPFILADATAQASSLTSQPMPDRSQFNAYVEKCLNAATAIALNFGKLCERGRMYQAFWLTLYYTFSAAVVLYVFVIKRSRDESCHWEDHLKTAQKAHRQLAAYGIESSNSLAQRYVLVLDELNIDTSRMTEKGDGAAQKQVDADHVKADTMSSKTDETLIEGSKATSNLPDSQALLDEENLLVGKDPATTEAELPFLADFADWDQFDALALTGPNDLGNLFAIQAEDYDWAR